MRWGPEHPQNGQIQASVAQLRKIKRRGNNIEDLESDARVLLTQTLEDRSKNRRDGFRTTDSHDTGARIGEKFYRADSLLQIIERLQSPLNENLPKRRSLNAALRPVEQPSADRVF